MEIVVKRTKLEKGYTIGILTMPDFTCNTLEDEVREVKVMGETAIPAGTYEVVVNRSMRFKKDLPLLVDVPNFAGVRIHSGNTSRDTQGCILVGTHLSGNFISNSRKAFDVVFYKIKSAIADGEKVTIEICNG